MTELRSTKTNVVAVEQSGGILASRKMNIYVVEQPRAEINVTKTNVVAVEQPITDLRANKLNVYVVEQRPPDMWYRLANPGDTPTEYDVDITAPPLWAMMTPWVNLGARRITEGDDNRVTEAGVPRRVEERTVTPTWVEPIATYVYWQGAWRYIRGPNSPFDPPP